MGKDVCENCYLKGKDYNNCVYCTLSTLKEIEVLINKIERVLNEKK